MHCRVFLAAAALACSVCALTAASPAHAQDGNYRHFTRNPIDDVNGSDRIIYAPVVSHFPGARPGEMPYNYPVASWGGQFFGSRNVSPVVTSDHGKYQLEVFQLDQSTKNPILHVSIVRRPIPPEGEAPPQLRVIDNHSSISTSAFASVERLPDGLRYQFTVAPPLFDIDNLRSAEVLAGVRNFQLDLFPARDVERPKYIAGAPGFGGLDPLSRAAQPRPSLPSAERVAGKRLEYRSAKSPGPAVQEHTAGKRQEERQ